LKSPFAVLAVAIAVLLAVSSVAPAEAQSQAASSRPDHRYEVTLVFGASLLRAETESGRAFPIDSVGPLEDLLPPGTLRQLLPTTVRQQDRIGGSFLQGFQIARRLGGRAWLEGEFLIAPAHTRRRGLSFRCPAQVCALAGLSASADGVSVEERVVAYHYGLGFAYELARGDVRPYLSVGAGAVTYDLPREGATSFALEVGAGARFAISDHLGARLEVADRIVPDHFLTGDTEHDVQVRAGAVFRLP
jgi:outer membrane protein with beta-barrel domain